MHSVRGTKVLDYFADMEGDDFRKMRLTGTIREDRTHEATTQT